MRTVRSRSPRSTRSRRCRRCSSACPTAATSCTPMRVPILRDDFEHVESSLLPDGSPVGQTYDYRHRDLLAVLTGIMAEFQPTVVRIADTSPASDLAGDHADHIAVAGFARLAAEIHARDGARVTLRGASRIQRADRAGEPVARQDAGEDRDLRRVPRPRRERGRFAAGVAVALLPQVGGRRRLGDDRRRRTHARVRGAGRGSAALAAGRAGRTMDPAALPRPARASPRRSPSAGTPTAGSPCSASTWTPATCSRATSSTPGGAFSEWIDLGNPSDADNNLAPAVVPNEDGRLEVFLRNSGTGLSTIYETEDELVVGLDRLRAGRPAGGARGRAPGRRTGVRRHGHPVERCAPGRRRRRTVGWEAPHGARRTRGRAARPASPGRGRPALLLLPDRRRGGPVHRRGRRSAATSPRPTSLGERRRGRRDRRAPGGRGRRPDLPGAAHVRRARSRSRGRPRPTGTSSDWVDLGGMAIGSPALIADAGGLPGAARCTPRTARCTSPELVDTSPITWGDWAPSRAADRSPGDGIRAGKPGRLVVPCRSAN